jgi:hypothetical protein
METHAAMRAAVADGRRYVQPRSVEDLAAKRAAMMRRVTRLRTAPCTPASTHEMLMRIGRQIHGVDRQA